jgi:hypothetical protein
MRDSVYLPAGGLVKWLTILLVAKAVIGVVALWSGWLEIELIERAAEGISDDEADANDQRQGLIGVAQFGMLIALIVLFCLWIPRANRNARALGATGMRFTPRWCVIWYVIPIMNLFRPYQAMKEIWKASVPNEATPWQNREASGILPLWWTLWLASGFAGRLAWKLSTRAEDLDEILRGSWATFVADAVDIPLAVVAMLLVRGIHAMQERSRYTTAFD